MTSAGLYRITAPHFVAGFLCDVVVRQAAPIIRYMEGWSLRQVVAYVQRKRWNMECCDD